MYEYNRPCRYIARFVHVAHVNGILPSDMRAAELSATAPPSALLHARLRHVRRHHWDRDGVVRKVFRKTFQKLFRKAIWLVNKFI